MDMNVQAFRLVREATEEPSAEKKRRQAASKRGGLTGGRARAVALSSEKRSEIAKKASAVRWNGTQQAVEVT